MDGVRERVKHSFAHNHISSIQTQTTRQHAEHHREVEADLNSRLIATSNLNRIILHLNMNQPQ